MIFVLGPLWFVLAAVILFRPGVIRFIGGGIRVVLILLLVGWLLAGVAAMLQHIPWLMLGAVIVAVAIAIGLFIGLLRIYDAVTDDPKDDDPAPGSWWERQAQRSTDRLERRSADILAQQSARDDDSDMTAYTAEVLGRVAAQRTAAALTATAVALAVAHDETMARADESDTQVVTDGELENLQLEDDTMAAPEAPEGETTIIADADAVTHLDLAWSDEQDVIPYPDTGTVDVAESGRSWLLAVGIGAAILAAGLVVADGVGLLHHADYAATTPATTTAEPWPAAVLAAPTQTAPPVTETPPPVTIIAPAPTVTQTPNPRAVYPTPRHTKPPFAPTDDQDDAVLANIRSYGYHITGSAAVISEAHESCRLTRQGERAREVDETLAAEHDDPPITLDAEPVGGSIGATIISSAAVLEYANCY
jgi:hypothetical protein